ncbi:MAG: DUF4091 domain-containing protein [Phycisphaerales bacterium]|nr:DUF4091 domain-containing protein [Phycisphaerales bacterium]
MLFGLIISCLASTVFVDELSPLYPDADLSSYPTSWTSDAVPGQLAGVHVIGQWDPQLPLTIRVTDEKGDDASGFAAFRLHDVPVEENTGLDSRTEQFKGDVNPHVIRRAPFRIYEAIEPLDLKDGVVEIQPESGLMAFRLEVNLPVAGVHELDVHVMQEGRAETMPWTILVHDWVPKDQLQFGYTNWFSPTEIASRHDVEAWSEEFWPVLSSYARLMNRGRQDTFWMRWVDFFTSDGERNVLDANRLERYVRTFLDAGLVRIEGAPIASRPDGDWSKDWLQLRDVKHPANSDEGRVALADMAGQMRDFMKEHGWTDRWVQHLADEPTDVNAADYAKLAEQVHQLLPGVPIIEATMTRSLVGSVDIWCPQVHKYQQNIEFFRDRQAEGDQVWTYTCLVPGGPWLNRLMDQERLRSVYFGWAGAKFDLQGFLHWGLNHYKADPFMQSVVDHPAMPNTTNKLPAGDTHVVFPGPDGPWSSTRFEAQRIGMEDLQALRELRARDPDLCRELIGRVFRGYDDWEPDVARYRLVRRQLFEALASPSSMN